MALVRVWGSIAACYAMHTRFEFVLVTRMSGSCLKVHKRPAKQSAECQRSEENCYIKVIRRGSWLLMGCDHMLGLVVGGLPPKFPKPQTQHPKQKEPRSFERKRRHAKKLLESHSLTAFRVSGLGFRAWGLGFGRWALGFGLWALGFGG